MRPPLTPAIVRALNAFQTGIMALETAYRSSDGRSAHVITAIIHLQQCFEWITVVTYPQLWEEAKQALSEARDLLRSLDGPTAYDTVSE